MEIIKLTRRHRLGWDRGLRYAARWSPNTYDEVGAGTDEQSRLRLAMITLFRYDKGAWALYTSTSRTRRGYPIIYLATKTESHLIAGLLAMETSQ